jgi:hypothetical protein
LAHRPNKTLVQGICAAIYEAATVPTRSSGGINTSRPFFRAGAAALGADPPPLRPSGLRQL